MKVEDDPRSLDLCAIGLGQGGGNLAAEWRRRGYRAVLFNTARSDLRALAHHEGLAVPDDCIVDIGLEGSEGAGKDPEYGAACVRAHADEIRASVETQLKGADGLLACAGLGGGTGSAVDALLEVLAPLDIPTIAVATLPSGSESGIAKVNAIKTANSLVSRDLAGRVFIDNDRLVGSFPDLDLVSWFPAVNARVLAPLDELNRLNRRDDLWSIRTFDGEDLRKVLLSGGVLQTHVARLSPDRGIDAAYLVEIVEACVDGGNHLARGLDLTDVAYLALVVVGPESALRATSMHVFDDAVRALKERSGGGAVYEGLYVGPDDVPLRAYVLSASLALPQRIDELLASARDEGGELARKIREEIRGIEVSPLDGLELFRTPTRRPEAGSRPPAPAPRPLGEQLDDDISDLEVSGRRPADVELGAPAAAETPALKPRVGSGQYDDAEVAQMEPTFIASEKRVEQAQKKKKKKKKKSSKKSSAAQSEPSGKRTPPSDATPRVGSGRWDDSGVEQEPTVHVDEAQLGARPESLPKGSRGVPIRPQTDRAALLPDDSEVDFDLDHDAESFELDANLTDPEQRHQAVDPDGDSSSEGKTRTDARPSFDFSDEDLMRSVIDQAPDGTELQNVYEDLIDRFRQANDERGRDRVARRLVDDVGADDVEVRALAVWAMVKLEDPRFKRALKAAATDNNVEIVRLASSGLERIE
jgi:cell division GTPase FtsZ